MHALRGHDDERRVFSVESSMPRAAKVNKLPRPLVLLLSSSRAVSPRF